MSIRKIDERRVTVEIAGSAYYLAIVRNGRLSDLRVILPPGKNYLESIYVDANPDAFIQFATEIKQAMEESQQYNKKGER